MVFCLSDTAMWNKLVTLFLQCLLDSKKNDSPIFCFLAQKFPSFAQWARKGPEDLFHNLLYYSFRVHLHHNMHQGVHADEMKLIMSKSDEQMCI